MASQADRQPVRPAELVAALSRGIDLGFRQPMEHVLLQFSPTEQLEQVSRHMTEAAKRMQGAGAPG